MGWAPATLHEVHFQPLVKAVEDRLRVLADSRFQAAAGDPANLKICRRGEWNDRMLIETVLSILTPLRPLKRVSPRLAAYVPARLAFPMAVFNLLVQWAGLPTDEDGFVLLSIAPFSL